jgi:endonuclease/exonuclease/phosphatase family metal-dependent hydrolase
MAFVFRTASRFALGLLCVLVACRSDDRAPLGAGSNKGGDGSNAAGGGERAGSGGAAGGAVAQAGAAGRGGAPVGGDGTVGTTLVTWNLKTFPLTTKAAPVAAKVIGDAKADLVAVNEIADVGAFSALAEAMPGYASLYADDVGSEMRDGLLYKTSRVALDSVETLFRTDTYAFTRAPLKAHATVVGPEGRTFDFTLVVVHLKALVDAESQARRRDACDKLAAWARAGIAAGDDADVVFAGDFNDEVNDPAVDNVFAAFFSAPGGFRALTDKAEQGGDYTYIPFKSFLDHVLVSDGAAAAYGAGVTTVVHAEQATPGYVDDVSDHRPVRVTFDAPR